MISDTYSIFWREMKRYKKSRGGFIIRLIQPAVWIIVMGNIFSGTQPLIQSVGFDGEYIEFMAPGIIILTAIFTSIFGGVNTLWDRRYGFMNQALTSPISRSSIALGKMLAISLSCSNTSKSHFGNCNGHRCHYSKFVDDRSNHGDCNIIFNWILWNICYVCCSCKITRDFLGNSQFSWFANVHDKSGIVSISPDA